MPEHWLAVAEVATNLGGNPDTIYRWIVRSGMAALNAGSLRQLIVNPVNARWSRQQGWRRNQVTV